MLPGFGQLLGLALHREIDQQGTQIQQLLPVHRHTIEAGPAEKTILLSLLATPLATDEKLVDAIEIKISIDQPALHRWGDRKTGFDPRSVASTAEQANTSCSLGTPKHRIHSIQKNGFSGSGLAGQHRETALKRQVQAINECDVLELKTGQHVPSR